MNLKRGSPVAMDLDHQFCSTRYYDLKKGERLKELQEKHSLWKSQLQGCDTRKQEILAELDRSKDLMRDQDQLRLNIQANLEYRATKAKVEELAQQIESLEERVLKIGGISTFESELVKLSQERERFLSEVLINLMHTLPTCLASRKVRPINVGC